MKEAKTPPCLIVIFGASGDLTKRKLIPSLYDLYATGQITNQFSVLGVSRTPMTDDQFRANMQENTKQFSHLYDEEKWKKFSPLVHYQTGDPTKIDSYEGLKERMSAIAKAHGTGENVILYLSLAPQFYEPVIVNIGAAGIVTEGKAWCSLNRGARPWQRIIVEKPFGHDIESAADLNRTLGRVFEEEAIYRIDHYLGKEIVQNLLVFRFANTLFEPIWNRTYIDHVQITASETVGVETRGSYYDSASGGALKDMIQSHLLQVMAVVAMEPPVTMDADYIRQEKGKVLRATHAPAEWEIEKVAVRGQYGPGQIDGKAVPGYRQEQGVSPTSQTDTYAALQVYVDTWRWGGVPFYLRSGKRMAKKRTEIVIYFKPTPHNLFGGNKKGQVNANQIVINIQPDEGIRIRFEGKVPGVGMSIQSVRMDFDYIKQFNAQPPEAYSTLLLDAMRGDQTLFKHRDEIEDAWRIVEPVVNYWRENPDDQLPNYNAGTWGPSMSDIMMARDGRYWRNP